ncbi:hypothetical protein KR009_006665 [Drosophila setifemur]|nr:hypothetical protein KR009_006665 [Drosophila setifemur]
MRPSTAIFSGLLILAACLLRGSEAVTCTADPTVTGCIDCATSPTDAECVAEAAATTTTTAAPTTVAETTTTAATTTTTTAASTSSSSSGGKKKVVRISNLRYTNVRRVRVYRNSSTTRSTLRTGNRRVVRRANVNNRRRNVRVIVG